MKTLSSDRRPVRCRRHLPHLRHFHRLGVRLRRGGFTLLELLVVITIIGFLAGLVFGGFHSVRKMARKTHARGVIVRVEHAVGQYELDHGYYPIERDGSDKDVTTEPGFLGMLMVDVDGGSTGYINEKMAKNGRNGLIEVDGCVCLVDPWGAEYRFRIDGDLDQKVANPDTTARSQSLYDPVIGWSTGPDLDGATAETGDLWVDNVASWR